MVVHDDVEIILQRLRNNYQKFLKFFFFVFKMSMRCIEKWFRCEKENVVIMFDERELIFTGSS